MASVESPTGRASSQARAQQKAKAAIAAPLPTAPPKKKRTGLIVLVVVLVLIGATYAAGRFIEPVRVRLEQVPFVGPRLFAKAPDADTDGDPLAEAPDEPATDPVQQALQNMDRREAELAAKAAELTQREEAVTAREEALEERLLSLDTREEELGALQRELEGRIEDDKARAAILGAMKPAQVAPMIAAMDDTEVLRLLKYLAPDVNGKILAAIDPNRAARLMLKLGGGQLQPIF